MDSLSVRKVVRKNLDLKLGALGFLAIILPACSQQLLDNQQDEILDSIAALSQLSASPGDVVGVDGIAIEPSATVVAIDETAEVVVTQGSGAANEISIITASGDSDKINVEEKVKAGLQGLVPNTNFAFQSLTVSYVRKIAANKIVLGLNVLVSINSIFSIPLNLVLDYAGGNYSLNRLDVLISPALLASNPADSLLLTEAFWKDEKFYSSVKIGDDFYVFASGGCNSALCAFNQISNFKLSGLALQHYSLAFHQSSVGVQVWAMQGATGAISAFDANNGTLLATKADSSVTFAGFLTSFGNNVAIAGQADTPPVMTPKIFTMGITNQQIDQKGYTLNDADDLVHVQIIENNPSDLHVVAATAQNDLKLGTAYDGAEIVWGAQASHWDITKALDKALKISSGDFVITNVTALDSNYATIIVRSLPGGPPFFAKLIIKM